MVPTPRTIKVVTCCDDFKGTLSAADAGKAIFTGLQAIEKASPSVRFEWRNIPLTDGGGGFLLSYQHAVPLRIVTVKVCGPFGTPVQAEYGVVESSGLAVVEMARAAGITMVDAKDLDPLKATSFGVGQMLKHADNDPSVKEIILGIGGSATNDAGLPALQALGLNVKVRGQWYGQNSAPLTGGDIPFIEDVRWPTGQLLSKPIVLACDVTNTFTGPRGATAIYGPQKGVTPKLHQILEPGMVRLGNRVKDAYRVDLNNMSGAGGAGGMSGLFHVVLRAKWEKGSVLFAKQCKLDQHIAWADVVVTGEGSYDGQSAEGKTLSGVAAACRQYGRPMIVVCGRNKLEGGAHPVLSLTPTYPVSEAMGQAAKCIAATVAGSPNLFIPPASKL